MSEYVESRGTWTLVTTVSGVPKPPVTTSNVLAYRYTKAATRSKNACFKTRNCPGGHLPCLPYDLAVESVDFPYGTSQLIYIPNGDNDYRYGYDPGGFGSNTYLFPSTSQELDVGQVLEYKALNKLKKQGVNLAVVFAERHQTIELISDTAERLAWSFLSLRRGDIRGAYRHLGCAERRKLTNYFSRRYKSIISSKSRLTRELREERVFNLASQTWLEIQYGWRPLLGDIDGAAKALAQYYYEHAFPISLATGKVDLDLETKTFNATGYDVSRTCKAKYRYGLYYRVDNSTLRGLGQLGLTDLATVAWEMIPYSFVVDWLLPVSSYLSLRDAAVGLTFVDGYWTKSYAQEIKMEAVKNYTYSNFRQIYNLKGVAKNFSLQRRVQTSFPSVSLPRVKNPFSSEHGLNALTLLQLAFSPRRPP